ncbi:MAG: hypothetical protein ACI9QC_000486 [Oceanicoccus sp.]|jgi:uncharacterized protein YdaU (DUF1376 family)
MSLESFFGLEEGESSGSKEASEAFQEQVRKNAKAITAMGKHQKKQSAQEDKLARILVAFLQDPGKHAAVFLVVKLLQDNVPGAFILAILSISDPNLQEDIVKTLQLLSPEMTAIEGADSAQEQLINFGGDGTLPEIVKQELNDWGELIYRAGALLPNKTLNTVLTPEYKLKSIVLDLIDYSLEEYFTRQGLELSQKRTRQFALMSIQSVLIKLRDLAQSKTDAEIIEAK